MSKIENNPGSGEGNLRKKPLCLNIKTRIVLQDFEQKLEGQGYTGTLSDWFREQSAAGISVRQVSRTIGLNRSSLEKIYRQEGINILSQPEASKKVLAELSYEARKKSADASRERLKTARYETDFKEAQKRGLREAMKRPETKRRMTEAARKRGEAHKERWKDQKWRNKTTKALIESWQNPMRRVAQSTRARLMHQDPRIRELIFTLEARSKIREESLRRWQDDEKRREMIEKITEGIRRSRANPEAIARFHLPTIHGYRGDIGFDAQSAWEANFARILIYNNREFYTRENFLLSVPEQYRTLFNTDQTQLTIDFIVNDPRGNLNVYELMAHPTENPSGWAKINMLIEQFPPLHVHIITERLYYRLKRRFQNRINADPRLFGWETREDNLYTNPDKFLGR